MIRIFRSPSILKNKESGVITVEACLVLPIFLCFFFLLLYLTRIACIMITLDQAAAQTAKHLAAASYPLSFINDFIDEKFESDGFTISVAKGTSKYVADVIAKKNSNKLGGIIWGGLKDDLINSLFEIIQQNIPQEYNKGFDSLISEIFLTEYTNLTNNVKYELVGDVLYNYLDTSMIKPEQLKICLLELPKGEAEFLHRKDDPIYQSMNVIPGEDFSREDVVVQLEYELQIPIPFYQDKTIKLRSTAVERGWTAGGNGVYTRSKEGLEFERWKKGQFIVYRARTGKKYHIHRDCFYLQKSCIPLLMEEAKEMELTVHVNCPRPFNH